MSFLNHKVLWKQSLSGILVCIFVALPLFTAFPRVTSAQQAVTVVQSTAPTSITTALQSTATAASTAASAVTNSLSAAALSALSLKEWTLDGIAWALAKLMLQGIMRSTTQWIASGFKGSPMFVTDPGAFMLDIADKTAGEIIYGSKLKFLCSPINIRIALNAYYQNARNRQFRCSITGIKGNLQQFIDGNFAAGGWPGFMSVALVPTNGNIGGALGAQIYIDQEIARLLGLQQTQWGWSHGFLSKEQCTGTGAARRCVTVTPGETISAALNFQVSASSRALIEAREINEMIGALFAQVLTQGLGAVSGIFGTSKPGSGSSGYGFGESFTLYDTTGPQSVCIGLSALDQINNPLCDPSQPTNVNNSAYSGEGRFFTAINDERTYQALHQRVITATNGYITEAKRRGTPCGINDHLISEAVGIQKTSSSSIEASQAIVAELTELQTAYRNATEQKKLEILNQYMTLVQSNVLHSSVTNVTEKKAVEETLQRITGNQILAIAGKVDTGSLISRTQDCPATSTPSVDTTDMGGSEGGG